MQLAPAAELGDCGSDDDSKGAVADGDVRFSPLCPLHPTERRSLI